MTLFFPAVNTICRQETLTTTTPVATGIGILYYFDRVVPEADIFVTQLQQWIVSFFSMTLATNLIGTGKRYPVSRIKISEPMRGKDLLLTGYGASTAADSSAPTDACTP